MSANSMSASPGVIATGAERKCKSSPLMAANTRAIAVIASDQTERLRANEAKN